MIYYEIYEQRGETPLGIAVMEESLEIVYMLINAGAKANVINRGECD